MKATATTLFGLLAVFTLAACSSVKVTTNYDHSAPFGEYKTYTLSPAPHGQKLTPRSEEVLRNAIRSQLAARGVKEATSGEGDLAIVRHVFTDKKISDRQYTDWGYHSSSAFGSGNRGNWPSGHDSYDMWSGAPNSYSDAAQYTEGTLIVDVVDTRTDKLVFRGTGTAVVGGQRNNARNIEKAVEKMVAAVPTKR
jgi:hypothetical protein